MKYSMIYSAMMLSALVLTACSDNNFGPDPEKDWQGTTTSFAAVDEDAFQTYYKPQVGTVGDPMPFYDPKAGDFKVMYLQEYTTNRPYRFHPYWALSTKDGSSYENLGEWLSIGDFDEQQDAILGTGCCQYNQADGLYYIYYTAESGFSKYRQVVMRATSADQKTWTRDTEWTLRGVDYGFSGYDFRDPQIFTVDGEYHMLVSTKPLSGGDPCFAEFKSADMKNWEKVGQVKMIWDRMLECPDVFEMGGKWYIVYSETPSWSRKVKYNMADSWEALKQKMNNGPQFVDFQEGNLDTRAFYAGKTASNGTDRYIWGWCPVDTHVASDQEEPSWSGSLVCHKVAQREDGTLYLTAVPSMAAKYSKAAVATVMAEGTVNNANGDVCEQYTLYSRLGYHNHISLKVETENADDRFGLTFGRGTDSESWTRLWFNNPHWDGDKKHQRRVEYYTGNGISYNFMSGGVGNFYPVPADNTWNIDIYTDNSILVMYVNGEGCYTARISNLQKNCWAVTTEAGKSVKVSNVKVMQY